MQRSAWYIGCSQDEVGDTAILVGDRGRIDRIAEHLEAPCFVEENRGLRTVTGVRSGKRITVSAFGMGAPIATIVLHELFDLGVRRFLRIGTAMAMPPAKLGEFVLAEGAVRGEGTSLTYAPLGFPAIADFDLGLVLRRELVRHAAPWRAGLFGTYDGFYTEMFALSEGEARPIDSLRDEVRRLGLIATDMETSALLVAGRKLGARVGSLCLATVDGLTQDKIDTVTLTQRERILFEIALDAMASPLDPSPLDPSLDAPR